MPFDTLNQLARFLGRERLIKAVGTVSVEIVLNQHDFVGIGVEFLTHHSHDAGVIHTGAALRDLDTTLGGEWFKEHEQRTGAVPLVLTVVAQRLAFSGRYWISDLS